jgi:hypothetical protein
MNAAGMNLFTSGSPVLNLYPPTGPPTPVTFSADPASGQDQRTVLIATPDAATEFSVTADQSIANTDVLDGTSGAVCFSSTAFGQIDCVKWGSYSTALPGPVGNAQDAIPDGSSIQRSIAPGCSTLLEFTDDTNDSQTDFSPLVLPTPRPNSVTPTETPCLGSPPIIPPVTKPGGPATPKKKKCKKAKKRSAAAAKKCKKK